MPPILSSPSAQNLPFCVAAAKPGVNSVAANMLQHARPSPVLPTLIPRFPVVLLLLRRRSSFSTTPWLHGNVRLTVVSETAATQTVMGFPSRLDYSRRQVRMVHALRGTFYQRHAEVDFVHARRRLILDSGLVQIMSRNLSLMCRSRVQDVCAITLFRSPWPVCPSLSVLSSFNGRNIGGQLQYSSDPSVWKRYSSSATASVNSGDTQTIGELWEEYFADPFHWWDNRDDKKNPKSPDFKHKVKRKGLWIDGWSTPAWVKARLKPVSQGRLQCQTGYGIKDSQGSVQGRRPLKVNNGRESTLPTSAREVKEIVQNGDGTKHLRSIRSTSVLIAILTNLQLEGITIDAYMYVEVLKRCLKQKDFTAAKQVHDCIIRSRIEKNTYVANNILSTYIGCERLKDARRVFDGLLKKDVISWNIMIGGYAQYSHARDAMGIFHQMLQEGVQPNEITCFSILKACASPSALKWGKEVHAYIRQSGLGSGLRVARALVHMYVRTGSIEDARLVFDRMGERDVITWTMLIGGFAQYGRGHEAFELFLRMQRDGVKPDAITYMSILNACASGGALEWVKEVHLYILEAGLESDLRVAGALVHMYAKNGSLDDARQVFDRMKERDVVTWNIMIGGLANHGRGQEAYELFLRMQREGCVPNAVTYLSILNACASTGALEWVKDLHSHILTAGLEKDLRVGNALVHMYSKSGSLDDARQVFDRMEERDVITWTVMVGGLANHGRGQEAYELFLGMQREGCVPNAVTYLSILNACASTGALEWVKDIHSHILTAGLEKDLRVGNALIHMYAKSGSLDDARQVFDRMEERDVITWTVMIGAYAESGFGEEAYRIFLQMKREGFKPDAVTYVSILNTCASTRALEWVKEVHNHAVDAGFESDLYVASALVHMYAKSGSIDDARLVFDRMEGRDVTTWNVIIGAYAECGRGVEAYQLYIQMKGDGFQPNAVTYLSILNACASAGALDWVKEVHSHVQEAGYELDIFVGSTLVYTYGEIGSIGDARLVFDRMKERNVVTWTAMIGAYAESGLGVEAYQLYLQMKREGFQPNVATYVSILNACASVGALEWVKDVHSHILAAGLEKDLRVGNALVHMYAKNGSIDDARLVFDRMEERDVITWNIMLGGLAQHGLGHEALELFRKMDADGVKPDECSFVAVLSACSHAGLVDEGCRLFSVILQDYGIEPNVLHCNCMVDLLGRGGHLEEAKCFIDNMPVEPNGATWGTLLGACRSYGNVELGELAANEVFKLQPKDASPYVLLSNIYAAAGKWDEVSLVRTMMQERGIRKEPGRSWIEVDDKFHEFVSGDMSHPEAREIYAELNRLIEVIKAKGYIPDTRLVLKNIEEEDKEQYLCSHSEKLAIAFGLMHTPRGKPIRVYKNLRVCSDCHTATKFISKVTGREIVARDANRFHQFKDGVCSCGGYW